MIYPAQTSLIPAQIALARFWEQGGSVFTNYPYWYLGTTPFRYLTGPILPLVLIGLHRILSFLSLFEIMLGLVGMAWVVGGIGVYVLVRELEGKAGKNREKQGEKRRPSLAVVAAIFYLFGPIVPFLFRFSGGLYLIAFSFLPFILLLYSRFLRGKREKTDILLCLLIAFIILLDSAIIPTMILGIAAIFLAQVGWKKAEEKLKQTFLIFSFSFLISSLWYTPSYWLVSLTGPSLAGKERLGVIFQLSKLLPAALAFALAIFSVRFFKKRHLLRDFCFYWLFIFGFLTLMRFISDPDFWLDWSSYGTELQLGIGMVLSLALFKVKRKSWQTYATTSLVILLVGWTLAVKGWVIDTLQRDITQTVEYRVGKQLSEIAKPPSTSSGQDGEKVFLSGTTAFWLNAFFDISQVRGGVDQASVYPTWRQAAWEIREGTEVEKSLRWLKELGISYLVVHAEDSEEFYHDFTYPEKFESVEGLEKVYDEGGDRIYRVVD